MGDLARSSLLHYADRLLGSSDAGHPITVFSLHFPVRLFQMTAS